MNIDIKDWKSHEFGEIASNIKKTSKDPLTDGYEKYVGLEHLEPGNIHIKKWGNVKDGTTFTRIFKEGQVLFAKRRAYQRKSALAEFKGVCSGDILVFQANKNICLPEILPFITQSDKFFEYAVRNSAGSLSPRTKYKDLAKLNFKLPPLDEQKRIADLLWSVDETIEEYWKTIRTLEITLQIFIDNLIRKPNKNFLKLGDYILIEKGLTYGNNDYGDERNGEILINLKCFEKFGGFNKNGIKFYKGKYEDKYLLKKNDIVIANTDITRSGDVIGYPILLPEFGNEKILYTMDVSRLKIKNEGQIISIYLFYLLRTRWAHWYMYSHSSGTTVLHLNLNSVNKLPIPKTNIGHQKKIAEKLKSIEENIKKYQRLKEFAKNIQNQIINKIFG